MSSYRRIILAGVSMLAFSDSVFAQDAASSSPQTSAEEADTAIIVTARRREEALQDVPLQVQAVTADELGKLNLKEFTDVQNVVPGLTLSQESNGIGTTATLRGMNFDLNASGNNGTIEFYLNEAPTSSPVLFQSMFDVSQIEVLRGPQGTLRGRASPSGSITVMTHRPDLTEAGFTGTGTLNTWGDYNLNGAINVPIVQDKVGIRLAGLSEEGDDNRVHSLNLDDKPTRQTRGGRVSVRADPFDGLTLNGSYTQTIRKVNNYIQVESANIADPTQPASPTFITASDRESMLRMQNQFRQSFTVWNWSAQYQFLGQELNYVGSHSKQNFDVTDPNDIGGVLPSTSPESFLTAAQITHTRARQTNHEVRLSSDERVVGIFDYVAGVMWNNLDSPTTLDVQTPIYLGSVATPRLVGGVPFVNHSAVLRTTGTKERSFFGNITAHIGDATEISGGIRRIRYHSEGALFLSGSRVTAADEDRTLHATIYSASIKHNFTQDLMVYANFGTSWRPGGSSNAIQTRGQPNVTGVLASLLYPDAEKSKSYEAGFKSQWFDRKLRVNLAVYHQTFDNFAYSASNIFYLTTTNGTNGVGTITSFAAGVPAEVNGVEGEIAATPLPHWDIGATFSYSKSKIKNATVPCNIYGTTVPTAAQLLAATGGEQVATCQVDGIRAGRSAPFVASIQSEYNLPLTNSADGYLRGLLSYYGDSQNDPTNPFDDIPSYGLLNVYAGLRHTDGNWDLGFYVKNLFNVERVLARAASPTSTGIAVIGGSAPASTYREITTTLPREIGMTLRVAFGSR